MAIGPRFAPFQCCGLTTHDGHVRVIQATIPANANRRFIRLNVIYAPPVNPWRRQ